jgi:flagellar biosynthesis/type III secretory pathway protein FliH
MDYTLEAFLAEFVAKGLSDAAKDYLSKLSTADWDSGYSSGCDDGYDAGRDAGYDAGYEDGYDIGFRKGYGERVLETMMPNVTD